MMRYRRDEMVCMTALLIECGKCHRTTIHLASLDSNMLGLSTKTKLFTHSQLIIQQ